MKLHIASAAGARLGVCMLHVRHEGHLLSATVFVLLSHHLVRPRTILCTRCRDQYNKWQDRPERRLTWK